MKLNSERRWAILAVIFIVLGNVHLYQKRQLEKTLKNTFYFDIECLIVEKETKEPLEQVETEIQGTGKMPRLGKANYGTNYLGKGKNRFSGVSSQPIEIVLSKSGFKDAKIVVAERSQKKTVVEMERED